MKDAEQNRRAGEDAAKLGVEDLLQHQDWLARLASRLVGGGAEAQDLVQETLLVGSSSSPPAGVELRAWLTGVARNLARSRGRAGARRTAREAEVARGDRVPSVLSEVTTIERQRDLLDALMELPETQRRVVMARYYEGWPPRRIASEFGLPLATVKSQLQRGIAGLRSRLDASYGSRESWMLAFLPLARSTGARAGGLLAGKGLLVAAAVLGLGAVGAWSLSRPAAPEGGPGANAIGAIESVAQLEGSSDREPVALEAPGGSEAGNGPRTSASMGERRVAVRAVVASTGVEMAVVDGFSVELGKELEDRRAAGHPLQSIEDLASSADPFIVDAEGTVFAEGEWPLVVHVVSGDLSGYAVTDDRSGAFEEVVVSLERVEPLVIRVVDSQGEPLQSVVPVAFDSLLPLDEFIPLLPEGHLSATGSMDWVTQDRNVVNGERHVRFLDHMRDLARPVISVRSAQLRAFHVNVPGLLEFFPELVKFRHEVRMPAPLGEAVVELVAPDLGAIELQVTSGGVATEVSGTASLSWLDAPAELPDRRFRVPLVDGRASWPRVVAGAHPFSVELNVKSHGQTWSVEGTGPEGDGDAVTLGTELSLNPVLLARVVGPTGAPLEIDSAWLRCGVPSPSSWGRSVGAKPTLDGALAFPIATGTVLEPPYVLEVQRNGAAGPRWARAELALTDEEARLGKDLGVIELAWTEPITVQGQVVDREGHPVPEAVVSLTRNAGPGSCKQVDPDGRFALSNGFGHEETLRVHSLADGQNIYTLDRTTQAHVERTVAPHEWTDPLVLVVVRAPAADPNPTEELRRIEVRWPEFLDPVTGKTRQSLDCVVLDGDGQQVGSRTQGEVLIPIDSVDPAWTLWVSSMWCRPRSFAVSSLNDVLEIELEPGIATLHTVSGESPMDSRGSFERVPGGPVGHAPDSIGGWHSRALLPRVVHDGDCLDVPFPQAGRYELVIYRTARDGSGRIGSEVTSERTGKFIDVFDPFGNLPNGITPEMARERNASLVLEY